LISDGIRLFCYSDENRHNDGLRFVQRTHPFGTTELVRKDETLGSIQLRSGEYQDTASGYIVVTEELTDEDWIELDNGELVVFEKGDIVYPPSRL
jgi:predicted glutamine amidotransferase